MTKFMRYWGFDLLYGLKEGKIGYLDEYFRETEKYRSGHL